MDLSQSGAVVFDKTFVGRAFDICDTDIKYFGFGQNRNIVISIGIDRLQHLSVGNGLSEPLLLICLTVFWLNVLCSAKRDGTMYSRDITNRILTLFHAHFERDYSYRKERTISDKLTLLPQAMASTVYLLSPSSFYVSICDQNHEQNS